MAGKPGLEALLAPDPFLARPYNRTVVPDVGFGAQQCPAEQMIFGTSAHGVSHVMAYPLSLLERVIDAVPVHEHLRG
jgi:hypothetical protein